MQKKLFLLAMMLTLTLTILAQVTTSALSGKVTMVDTKEEVIGATIQAVHEPSGTKYAGVTNSSGRFAIQGMRNGGPYTVTVSYIGYETKTFRGIDLQLGDDDEVSNNTLSDIGNIGIPDHILNKPARLTDDEYAVMKSHVTRGAEILKDFTLLDHVVDGARYHHEKYDGTGYPDGLKGEDIPLYGRIIGVADAFDAMTANRVYRKQMDFSYVLNEMRRCSGTQFDPKFVDILLKLIDEGKIDLNALYPVKTDDAPKTDEEARKEAEDQAKGTAPKTDEAPPKPEAKPDEKDAK